MDAANKMRGQGLYGGCGRCRRNYFVILCDLTLLCSMSLKKCGEDGDKSGCISNDFFRSEVPAFITPAINTEGIHLKITVKYINTEGIHLKITIKYINTEGVHLK